MADASAYHIYANKERTGSSGKLGFAPDHPGAMYRRIFGLSRPVVIEFIGAWDTVSSLGGFGLPRMPFAGSVAGVTFFRQALALDERRVRFMPEYQHRDLAEKKLMYAVKNAEDDLSKGKRGLSKAKRDLTKAKREYDPQREDDPQREADPQRADDPQREDDPPREDDPQRIDEAKRAIKEAERVIKKAECDLKGARKNRNREYPERARTSDNMYSKRRYVDCWFMGSHSDVGGGDDPNGEPSLSNIPFRYVLS